VCVMARCEAGLQCRTCQRSSAPGAHPSGNS
jgi:hypothetical protein